ncbi:MAG: hypothetical protein JSR93_06430 [Verrucomicrobia bacterium]|nr:hypothetical protein [Verrucomicrobiota bacterium]
MTPSNHVVCKWLDKHCFHFKVLVDFGFGIHWGKSLCQGPLKPLGAKSKINEDFEVLAAYTLTR